MCAEWTLVILSNNTAYIRKGITIQIPDLIQKKKLKVKRWIFFFNFRSSPFSSLLLILFTIQWAAKCNEKKNWIEVSLVIYEFKIIRVKKKLVTEKWSALDGFKKINPDFHRAFIHNIHHIPNFQCRTRKFFYACTKKKVSCLISSDLL